MKSFINTYKFNYLNGFQNILPINNSDDVIAVGGCLNPNGVIVCRIDSKGNILWSKKIGTEEHFIIQHAQVLTNGNSVILAVGLSRHTLICIEPDGKIKWTRSFWSGYTGHNTTFPNQIINLNNQVGIVGLGFTTKDSITNVECITIDNNGNFSIANTVKLGAGWWPSTAISIENNLFIAGSKPISGGENGFIFKLDKDNSQIHGSAISYKDSKEKIDIVAICDLGNNLIAFVGDKISGKFISIAYFDSKGLQIISAFALKKINGYIIKKILNINNHIYVLSHNGQTTYVSKVRIRKEMSLVAQNNSNQIIWTKSFDEKYVRLSDIIQREDHLYLTGVIYKSEKGENHPILIKTDLELESCLTTTVSETEPLVPIQISVSNIQRKVSPLIIKTGDIRFKSAPISLDKEELCPPIIINKNECPTTFVAWNNLRPRARTRKLDRAVKAEIRDAAWMLSRQWQWGEFNGSDGGSIVFSKLSVKNSHINRYTHLTKAPKNSAYTKHTPLEYKAEKLQYNLESDHLLRIKIGQYWMKLLENTFNTTATLTLIKSAYHKTYPYALPVIPDKPIRSDYTDVDSFNQAINNYIAIKKLESDHISWATLIAANGRAVDGYKLFKKLHDNPGFFPSDLSKLAKANKDQLDKLKKLFIGWIERNYGTGFFTNQNNAWSDQHLEYQFGISSPDTAPQSAKIQLKGDEYKGGTLDWYNLDYDTSNETISDANNEIFQSNEKSATKETRILIPAKIDFAGMPTARWWEMEDHEVNFGDMYVNKTDISKLLLLDFIVNYADNWYLLPYQSEIGNLIHLEGIEVKDNFGIRTLINSSNTIDREMPNYSAENFRYWNLFTLANQEVDKNRLFLAPTCKDIQESKPFEKINFIRDEIANMVWGIEQIVPNALGDGIQGFEASTQLQALLKDPKEVVLTEELDEDESKPKLTYQLMTSVPENWIPFIPTHIKGSNRSIELQRAALPRDIEGFNNPVKPRTHQLSKVPNTYVIHEEQIPKVGSVLKTTWQRTRWINGKTYIWVGNQKQVGKQAGSSGLKFDQVFWEK